MKKRIVSYFVVFALIISLTACGGSKSADSEIETEPPIYNLLLKVEFEGNFIFDRDDLILMIDGERTQQLPHGEDYTDTFELAAGDHEIAFQKEGDDSVAVSSEITLEEDSTFECSVKVHKNTIDFKKDFYAGIEEVESETESTESVEETITEEETSAAEESTAESTREEVTEEETTVAETKKKESDVITVKNNKDFKKLVKLKDPGDPLVKEFSEKYYGRTISFDGAIFDMMNHGSYTTRFDVLIYPCEYDENTVSGPNFQFVDVNFRDMNIKNSDIIAPYKNYHFKCKVGEYNEDNLLFELEPISMKLLD